jgi:hypothetical protein
VNASRPHGSLAWFRMSLLVLADRLVYWEKGVPAGNFGVDMLAPD